jgi:hypothetical protein
MNLYGLRENEFRIDGSKMRKIRKSLKIGYFESKVFGEAVGLIELGFADVHAEVVKGVSESNLFFVLREEFLTTGSFKPRL